MINSKFWHGKKVFITGITGFKGSWLAQILLHLGAEVHGYALAPEREQDLFNLLHLKDETNTSFADIRDFSILSAAIKKQKPEIIFHLAAQPLIKIGFESPWETFSTNMMGSLNILEIVRNEPSIKVLVNVTTDKVYPSSDKKHQETDALWAADPYSASKVASELLNYSYNESFFKHNAHTHIGCARSGNVIGGGDWGDDRLIPDIMRALENNSKLSVRNLNGVRPWMHVLDVLKGYLLYAEQLASSGNHEGSVNFGPDDHLTVSDIHKFAKTQFPTFSFAPAESQSYPEANTLKLDNNKAKKILNWSPKWNNQTALSATMTWYKNYYDKKSMKEFTLEQVRDYFA